MDSETVTPVTTLLNKPLLKTCPVCGIEHNSFWRLCEDCLGERAEHKTAVADEDAKAEAHRRLIRAWNDLCPAEYRSTRWTDPDFQLSPVARQMAKEWWAGKDGRGLGLWGSTGQGKTRAMYEILRRHHFRGLPVHAVQSTALAKAALDAVSDDYRAKVDARWLLRRCRRVYLLLIDDLGKERATPRVAAELHEIWEFRTSNRLPTLWTCEKDGEWLAGQLGDTYGDGLIRRIRGYSIIRCVNHSQI